MHDCKLLISKRGADAFVIGVMDTPDALTTATTLTRAVINAQAALRWLGTDPPNLDEARQALGRVVDSGDGPATSSAGSARSSPRRRRAPVGSTSTRRLAT